MSYAIVISRDLENGEKIKSLCEGFNFLDHILLSFHFIHCFPEFNFLKFDGFSTFISSNVFTDFNYLKFYLSWPSFHLFSTSKFNFPSSYLFKTFIFHSFPILNFSYPIFAQPLVHPLSSLGSIVQSYPSPLPIYHPMFYFPLFHFISSIVFPRFNISQFFPSSPIHTSSTTFLTLNSSPPTCQPRDLSLF